MGGGKIEAAAVVRVVGRGAIVPPSHAGARSVSRIAKRGGLFRESGRRPFPSRFACRLTVDTETPNSRAIAESEAPLRSRCSSVKQSEPRMALGRPRRLPRRRAAARPARVRSRILQLGRHRGQMPHAPREPVELRHRQDVEASLSGIRDELVQRGPAVPSRR